MNRLLLLGAEPGLIGILLGGKPARAKNREDGNESDAPQIRRRWLEAGRAS